MQAPVDSFDVDIDIDVEMNVPAAPPRVELAAPVARIDVAPAALNNVALPWPAPPPPRLDLEYFTDDLADVEPVAAVESTEDVERPARSFPFVKLAIAAVLVSGISAAVTLKVMGIGQLSSSADPVSQITAPLESPPPAAPVVEPIASAVEPIAAAPAVEPIAAAPAVEPIAAAPAVEPIAAAPAVEPIAAAPAVEPIAAAPAAVEPIAAAPAPEVAAPSPEQAQHKPARSKHRTKRSRSAAAKADAASTRARPAVATADGATRGQGTLMISTKPPCEIAIDGVATMLTTPQRALKLRPGKHKVTLFNDSLNISATFPVVIEAGKPTKLIRDFMPK